MSKITHICPLILLVVLFAIAYLTGDLRLLVSKEQYDLQHSQGIFLKPCPLKDRGVVS